MKSLSQMTAEELKTLCKSLESRYGENSTVTIKQSDFNNMWTSLDRYAKENKRLYEQLKEANEVIKYFAHSKAGVEQEDGRFIVGLAGFDGMKAQAIYYDPRPADKYIKKWGVK